MVDNKSLDAMQGGGHPDNEPLEETEFKDSTRGLQGYIALIDPNIIPHLKYIAEVMFISGYDAECCQSYISIRKDALEECFLVLEVEKLSTDDVLQMDWISLSSKIKKWVRAAKIFIHVYLANEKCLAEKVLGVSRSVGQNCFIEASKSLVLQLLSFGSAVAIRNHSSDTIFQTLHMYDGLADLLPYIDALYSDEAGSCVSTMAHEVLARLDECVRTYLNESKNPVTTDDSSTLFTAGWVHHLVRYVAEDNTRGLEDYNIDLVDPNIIPHVKYLAGVISASGYVAECCQAYISVRKDALEECLLVLEVENLSVDDVLQMDWNSSYSEIKKWVQASKTFIRVVLANEKCLADKVFGFSGSLGQNCFIEASKSLVLQLLSFSETVMIRPHSSEMIFHTLYVYDGLADLLPDIDSLFSDEAGSCVSTVAHEVLTSLGESVRIYLNEFKNDLRKNELSTPCTGYGVNHLTRYVMNYLKALTDYSDIVSLLLKGGEIDHFPSSSNVNMEAEDDSEFSSSSSASPMALCLQSMISLLESNLESKSQLYGDVSLQHFFLMNNIYYIAQKVKNSKLQAFVGENWITKQNEKFQQHAVSYRSASWNQVLYFLRDDDVHIPHSDSVCKAILKVRSQCFNLAFEEIYRVQTAWLIPDVELEDDLRMSISSKLLLAYQTFLGRYLHQLAGENHNDQYIKYSVEDVQGFLFHLFQGSQRSLNESPNTDFYDILIGTRQSLEPERWPSQLDSDDMSFLDLMTYINDGSSEGMKARLLRNKTRGLEDCIINLVHPNVIPDLKGIIELMFASGYEAECCQAYISIIKEALEGCLRGLYVEGLFINDILHLQMDWSSLSSNIKKWVKAMKVFIYVYLVSEKSLASKVFEVSEEVSQTCFIEASKNLILQLLSFGEAVAIRNYSPERILLLLYMYDALFDLVPVIDVLFSHEVGSYVRNEAHGILSGLGESVTRTLDQFRSSVKTNAPSTQFTAGGVHHLTMYVMKYLTALAYYSDILNFILNFGGDDHLPSSLNVNTTTEVDGKCSSYSISLVSTWLQSTLSILKSNLKRKSMVYTNASSQHVFMMNNLWYVAQNVKDSELYHLLGESWVSKHNGIFQQLVADYERTSWSLVRSFLRHESVLNAGSSSVSKSALKERFQRFNLSFEEIYRKETALVIHDEQLRIELRTSISSKILVEYRLFLERFSSDLKGEKHRDRYLKYSVEDLQESLSDLFKGSSKGLHKFQRR